MQTKSIVLVDLDCILDTRLGTITKLNDEESVNVLSNGWRTRTSQDICSVTTVIDKEEYVNTYADRNIETLMLSRPTNLLLSMADDFSSMMKLVGRGATPLSDVCLVINKYPYQTDEQTDLEIQRAVTEIVGSDVPVRIANYPEESVQLSYLNMRGITDYFTYDVFNWIKREFSNKETFEDLTLCPNIAVWGPKLLSHDNAVDELLKQETLIDEKDDPFDFAKVLLAPCVNLQWLDVFEMSIIDFELDGIEATP